MLHNFFFHHTKGRIILSSKYPNSLNVFNDINACFVHSIHFRNCTCTRRHYRHWSIRFQAPLLTLFSRGQQVRQPTAMNARYYNSYTSLKLNKWTDHITFISRVCCGESPSRVWDVQNVESNVMINAKIYSTPIVFNVSFTKYFIIINVRIMYSLDSRLWSHQKCHTKLILKPVFWLLLHLLQLKVS